MYSLKIILVIVFLTLLTNETLEIKNKIDNKKSKKGIKNNQSILKTELKEGKSIEKNEEFQNYFIINNSTININEYLPIEFDNKDIIKKIDTENSTIQNRGGRNCQVIGVDCVKEVECCTGNCESSYIRTFCQCMYNEGNCRNSHDCCSGTCSNKKCLCKPTSQKCVRNRECCSLICNYDICVDCKPDGWTCEEDSNCCSGFCRTKVYFRSCHRAPIPLTEYLEEYGFSRLANTPTTTQNNQTFAQCSINETEEFNKKQRSGIPEERYRWRDGLFISIETTFSSSEIKTILKGLLTLHNSIRDCLPIYIWPTGSKPKKPYVIIRERVGCSSQVGKQAYQPQYISLGKGCVSEHTVIHEAMHALGLYHEHSRPDRDEYIDIHTDNIEDGKSYNFVVQNSITFGTNYGYDSIMHYESTAFSKNGRYTITKKNGGTIKEGKVIARTDLYKLTAMYCNQDQ